MAQNSTSFSRRFGFNAKNPPVKVWEDAPPEFRNAELRVARDDCKLSPKSVREIVCKRLRKNPNPNNWSPEPVWK